MRRKWWGERALSVASPAALLAVWEGLVGLRLLDARFFPAPSDILGTLGQMAASGELLHDVGVSVARILLGFFIGAVPAVLVGVVMGLSRWVRAVLSPIVSALYPIPKSAILPLLLLIFGIGEGSKVAMVAIGAFFLVLINSVAGVLNVERVYYDVGQAFGASRWQVIRTIALPGALPLILTGLELGLGMGLILVVVAEMAGAKNGVGYLIWNAWQVFAVDRMYVGLLVTAVLGYLSSLAMEELKRRIVPWRPE